MANSIRTQQDIAADYQDARQREDEAAMARFRNEEACLVLLSILERLASDPDSFIHGVAVKGGILMAGELRSRRVSADIDTTAGHLKRVDTADVIEDVREAGRRYNVRADGPPERTAGGEVIHLRFDSLTDGGTAKIEVSIREDLVFEARDALFNVTDLGLDPFTVPALAKVELVAEKIRTLVQRGQPRDLFDLRLYLCDSGWHLDPKDLLTAVNAKLSKTKHKKWKPGLWTSHLDEIEANWLTTLRQWLDPEHIPSYETARSDVERRLKQLKLG